MNRRPTAVLVAAVLTASLLAAAPPADPAPGGDDWKYDVVHLKTGDTLSGLIMDQDARHVVLRKIIRKPGAATLIFSDDIQRSEIDHIDPLSDDDRDKLAKRVQALIREREALANQLKRLDPDASAGQLASDDGLELKPTPWVADPKVPALAYQSTYFRLVSDARPEVVRLAAIHLEQIYAAYVHLLPPRVAAPRPTTILLTQSLNDYRALVAQQGRNLFNPAYFDPAKNQIVCASDLQRLADALERVRREADKAFADLKDKEKELAQAFGGRVPPDQLAPVLDARKKVKAIMARNEEAFATARRGCCDGSTTRPSTPTCPTASTRRPTARRRAGSTRAWRRFLRPPLSKSANCASAGPTPTVSTPFTPRWPRGRCCRRPTCSAPTTSSFRWPTPANGRRRISITWRRGPWPSTWPSTASCSARKPSTITSTPSSAARIGWRRSATSSASRWRISRRSIWNI